MKKILLILIAFLLAYNVYAMDEKYWVEKVYDKEITFSNWSSSYTYVPSNSKCYAATTSAGYSWQSESEPFQLGCDSVTFVAQIVEKGLTYDYVNLEAGIYAIGPEGNKLPTDTTTYNFIPKVLLKYYGQGLVTVGKGGIGGQDNAFDARQNNMLKVKLWIRIGYAYTTGQTIRLRIYAIKYRKGT